MTNADAAPAIALNDVHKSFGDQQVLRGLTLTIGRGERIAVLGRSGTGKSVMLKLIVGYTRELFESIPMLVG
jgi:phospholipid/cholesterol/gamma-HCH transport system ATP-binding protein